MRIFALLFCVGICALQAQAELSAAARAQAWSALAAAAFLALGARRMRTARMRCGARWSALALAALGAGFGWASLRAEWRLADHLHAELEGRTRIVEGRVSELPRRSGDGLRFVFAVDPPQAGLPARMLVSWHPDGAGSEPLPALRAGERWRLPLRLRRPRAMANPGVFDYEAWLLQKGVRATARVRGEGVLLDADAARPIERVHRWRGEVRDRFLAVLDRQPYRGMLVALAVGDQSAIPASQWDSLRRTGIAHLVSISGLHVGLVAGLAAALAGALWRRVPALVLRLPVGKLQALAALLAGAAYALLAGMGIPVQRALLMLAVAVLALLGGRALAASRILALALVVVLAVDPWAVLAPGFWLSFGAVALILYIIGGRSRRRSGWCAAVRVQLAISFGLLPLLLFFFHAVPVLAPVANALAVPLLSFVVTPLTLAAVLLPVDALLQLAHAAIAALMRPVEWLASIEAGLWEQAAPPLWLGLTAAVALAVLMLPRATPAKPAAAVMLALLLSWQAPRPPPGGFRAQVLDVGQGLAVHVQTARHDLMYDAGPRFGRGTDAGERVILPYLRMRGVRGLDLQVLSHDDADHVGGARSVAAALPVKAFAAPAGGAGLLPARARARLRACMAGQRWQWDGVDFAFLHPPAHGEGGARAGNEQSCVLRVHAAEGSLLLSGDIGAASEAALVAAHGADALATTVVVSAHHGSRSSSSAAFVDATMAEAVIHSVGHGNPFSHPHPQVWARWAWAGARNWRTDGQGAIAVDVAAGQGEGVRVRAQREHQARYWHGR